MDMDKNQGIETNSGGGAPSAEAMRRYLVVSQVLAREAGGQLRSVVVIDVAGQVHRHLDGRGGRRRSRATLYRWLAAYEAGGLAALEPGRAEAKEVGAALPAGLMKFIAKERDDDPRASIPELIERARVSGVIEQAQRVDRGTVWRACRSRGIATRRRRTAKVRDSRRFAYPHRMDMIVCDGKHFRAGASRAKRVALFYLDDSTRMALHVVVGTSENTTLFLRGLYEVVRRHGRFSSLYLDNGAAFKADDTAIVVAKLGANLILGEAGYPQGRGKIERFNQTAENDLLRHLAGRADVSPECESLELRLQHYLREVYNQSPHSSLPHSEGPDDSPRQRFFADKRALRYLDDVMLRQRFVVNEQRKVSNDHVISFEGTYYEVPRGHAGQHVTLHRNVLDDSIAMMIEGRRVELRVVDVVANAHSKRGAGVKRATDGDAYFRAPTRGAADLSYQRSLGPIVDSDGGYSDGDV